MDGYGEEAAERFVAEPPKRAGRTPFERDCGRVVHSAARELGKSLGCDPDIVDSAALAHDLGRPPFVVMKESTSKGSGGACSCHRFRGSRWRDPWDSSHTPRVCGGC
ncbi:hypothetical protein [Aeromicrobium sp.]|uniref:hypothetical protein n=1 Tax=Aeromicrobium sp. TaxID=1871063 RepID=UPI0039E2BBE9